MEGKCLTWLEGKDTLGRSEGWRYISERGIIPFPLTHRSAQVVYFCQYIPFPGPTWQPGEIDSHVQGFHQHHWFSLREIAIKLMSVSSRLEKMVVSHGTEFVYERRFSVIHDRYTQDRSMTKLLVQKKAGTVIECFMK